MRRVVGGIGRVLAACALVAAANPARATVVLSRTSATLYPTQSVSVTATITKGGLALPPGTHALMVTGLPAGVTVVPSPPTWAIPVGGMNTSATSTFQFVVGAAAVAGGPSMITVSDPTVGGSAAFALTIPEPTLSLGLLTSTLTLGSSPATVFVRVIPDPGFGANVGAGGVPLTFSVDAMPPSAPAHVTAGGTKFELAPYSSTLPFPFSRTGAATPGTYSVPVVATWPGTNHTPRTASATLTLSIPDISVALPALPVTVCNGGLPVSTNSFSLTPQFNYSGTPSLTVQAAPPGVTVTPPSVAPMPPGQSVTLTLQAAGAAAGSQSATLRLLDDPYVINKSFSVAFNVINPDITASSSPSILSLQAGGAAQNVSVNAAAPAATCNATPIVDVTVLGPPAGFTFPGITTLNPPSYGPANLSISAAASVVPGSYPATLRFTPRNGATPQDKLVTVTVTAGPDFNLGASPASLTLPAGASGSISFSVLPLNGFSGTASATIPAIQSVTATPSTFPLTVSGPQAVSFLVSAIALPGSYPATVSATAPGVPGTRTVNVTIVVPPPPDFTVAASPASVSILPGGTGKITFTVAPVDGWASAVALTVPAIANVTASPTSATIPGGSGSVDIFFTASSIASAGATPVTVTFSGVGPGSPRTHVANVTLVVQAPPDFTLLDSPSSLTLAAGGSGQTSVSFQGVNGFTGPVAVTAPAIPGTSFSPSSFSLASGATQVVGVSVAAGASPGTAAGNFAGTAPGIAGSRLVHFSVTVTAAPDYQLVATPSTLQILSGGTAGTSVALLAVNGYAKPVTVTASAPSGLIVTPATFTLGGATPQAVTIGGSAGVTGPFDVAFNGVDAMGLAHSTSVHIMVPNAPDFSLGVTPTSISLPEGGRAPAQVTLIPANGWSAPVDVVASGSPGVSVEPATFTLLPNAPQPVNIVAAQDAPAGAVTLLFHATGSAAGSGVSVTRTVNVQVSVVSVDFGVRLTPAAPRIVAGKSADLTFILDPIGSFAGTATLTPVSLPPGATLTPAQPLLSPGAPQAATLSIPRATPPGAYTLTFRADEVPAPGVRAARPLLISKIVTAPLVVLPAAGGFSVSAVPPTVLASPGQPIAIRYEFHNLGDETLLVTGDSLVRHDRNGVIFDSTDETVGLTLPPRGTASVSNTVLATGEQFAKSGTPAIVLEDRTFRAAPDSTGFVATATAPVAVTAANSLLATASVTRLSVVYPPSGTLVGRGDNLRAQGILFGSGTGTLLVGWLYDGVLVETASVPLQNGAPTSVTNSVSLPTLLAGNHEISLAILAPNTLSSPSVQIYVDEGLTTLRLVTPTAGALFAPAFSAPTFLWIPAPGIARYGVGLRRRGAQGAFRWVDTAETRWSPPASLWNALPEGDYEWVVRGYTASGRSALDRQNGGATAPPTSEGGSPDVAGGWTVTSSAGRFSIGAGSAMLADLGGQTTDLDGGVRFVWDEIAGALYIHTLYVESSEGPRRVRTEILPRAGLLLPAGGVPKGANLWRVTAVDREGTPLGATALKTVSGRSR